MSSGRLIFADVASSIWQVSDILLSRPVREPHHSWPASPAQFRVDVSRWREELHLGSAQEPCQFEVPNVAKPRQLKIIELGAHARLPARRHRHSAFARNCDWAWPAAIHLGRNAREDDFPNVLEAAGQPASQTYQGWICLHGSPHRSTTDFAIFFCIWLWPRRHCHQCFWQSIKQI